MTVTTTRPPTPATGPPQRSPNARRHSIATVTLARTMYGDGDAWTPTEIAAYMTTHGTPVARSTVQRWVDPEVYARQTERRRAARAAAAPVPAPQPTLGRPPTRRSWGAEKEALVLARAMQMRSRGLPYTAISVVLAMYEDVKIGPHSVRSWMRSNGAARSEVKAANMARQRESGKL